VAAAAYRAGVELLDERTGQLHDYTQKGGVIAQGILTPENAPEWAHDRARLWNAVEQREDSSTRRDSAQLARELVIALPHELDDQHREFLLKNILRDATRRGMVADYAIHAPGKEGDERNYHAHVMLTMRQLTPDGFGPKVREWNDRGEVDRWKLTIERETNRMMERCGHRERVSVQLDPGHTPTQHLGPAVTALERSGIQTEPGNRNREAEAHNRARQQLHQLGRAIREAERKRQERDDQRQPPRKKFRERLRDDLRDLQRAAPIVSATYDAANRPNPDQRTAEGQRRYWQRVLQEQRRDYLGPNDPPREEPQQAKAPERDRNQTYDEKKPFIDTGQPKAWERENDRAAFLAWLEEQKLIRPEARDYAQQKAKAGQDYDRQKSGIIQAEREKTTIQKALAAWEKRQHETSERSRAEERAEQLRHVRGQRRTRKLER
jgi:hypothetical protein